MGARRLSLNLLLNVAGTVVNALTGFVTMPVLIGRLGPESYGFWTLIVAATGWFLVLDFGVSGAVGRLVAGARARNDVAAMSAAVSTTGALLSAIGLLVALATLAMPALFEALFAVPPEDAADVRAAILVVGLTSALYFPAAAANGVLWGHERFDLYNAVELPVLVGRAVTILAVVREGTTLFELSLIVAGWTLLGYAARALLARRVEPRLRIGRAHVSAAVAREAFAFGGWFGLLTFTRQTLPQIATFAIGHGLGPAAVTTFTIPRLLAAYSTWLMVSGTQVLAPRAAAYHYGGDGEAQRRLFLSGGRWCFATALFLTAGMILLGRPLLEVWQPGDQEAEYALLVVLMLGELLPMSQWVTYNTAVGIGRHRRLVIYGIAEILVVLALSLAVMPTMGLLGVAVVVAGAGVLFRGLLQMLYGCRLMDVRPVAYVATVFGVPVLAAAAPILATAVLVDRVAPSGWIPVFAAGFGFAALYWAVLLPVLIGRERLRALLAGLSARMAGREPMAGTPAPSDG